MSASRQGPIRRCKRITRSVRAHMERLARSVSMPMDHPTIPSSVLCEIDLSVQGVAEDKVRLELYRIGGG
jgi:hypothetical protein